MSSGYNQLIQDHYDRLTSGSSGAGSGTTKLRPFFTANRDDEEATLKWLSDTIDVLEDEQTDRAINQVNNINFYHGLQRLNADSTMTAVNWNGNRLNKYTEFVMNHCRDFVHQSVSRLTRYSANLNVSPVNNEYKDRLGARTSKRVIDNIFYVNSAEETFQANLLEAKLCGESYLFPIYNAKKGDIDPAYQQHLDMQKAAGAPVVSTQYFENVDGEMVPLNTVRRVGEVDWVHPLPWMVLTEPAFRWKDVNYAFYFEIKHIDEIAAENPNVDLGKARPLQLYKDISSKAFGPSFRYGEYLLQYHFYHKSHPLLDKGWYCKFVPGQMLKSEPLPYTTQDLPVARFTDWDDPMNAHGVSFLEDLKPPLVLQNKMLGLMYRNIAIANHPKLLVPEGSCNINSMANGPLVVEYQYPMKPEILAFNSNGQDIFAVSEKFMGQTTQLSGTFDISRGGTVPNARAASILNFYEEQEEQRESFQIKKYSRFIEKVARLSLGIAGDFYSADDGRTIRVVGARNQYKLRKLEDVSKLSGPYDIKVERTTALSESKQGRIDQIVQLSQIPLSNSQMDNAAPGVFTREQILRMIEVADTPTFFEMSTAAVEKQESENEDMFEGIAVDAPQPWEAHEICWNVLFQFMQSREFIDTKDLPQQVKDAVIGHMRAHEMFMYLKAQRSLTYAMELTKNVNWPCAFAIGPGAQPQFSMTLNQIIQMHNMPPPPMLPPGGAPGAPSDLPPLAPPGEDSPEKEPMPEQEAASGERMKADKKTDREKSDKSGLDIDALLAKGGKLTLSKGKGKRKYKIKGPGGDTVIESEDSSSEH